MDKVKIENIEDFVEWINSYKEESFYCEIDTDSLFVECNYRSSMYIWFEEKDTIRDIILRAIEYFEDFRADNEFDIFLESGYVRQYAYTPSECIRMLMSDEESFHALAKELREMIA
jgi:hypothetical protein